MFPAADTPDPCQRLSIRCAGEDAVLSVRVVPGAGRSGILGVWNDALRVAVRSPPEDGRANRELCDVLAAALKLRRRDVEITAGETARLKAVRIARMTPASLRAALSAIVRG